MERCLFVKGKERHRAGWDISLWENISVKKIYYCQKHDYLFACVYVCFLKRLRDACYYSALYSVYFIASEVVNEFSTSVLHGYCFSFSNWWTVMHHLGEDCHREIKRFKLSGSGVIYISSNWWETCRSVRNYQSNVFFIKVITLLSI